MSKIILQHLEFYAYHGYYKEEQKIGGRYIVDIEISLDLTNASNTDKLEQTIDYAQIYSLVEDEMKKSSRLIENVAGRIINRVINEFNTVEHVLIKLTKVNPPIKGNIKSVSVIMEKER